MENAGLSEIDDDKLTNHQTNDRDKKTATLELYSDDAPKTLESQIPLLEDSRREW